MQNVDFETSNTKNEHFHSNSQVQGKPQPTQGQPRQQAATVWKSFGYASEGVVYVIRTQRNAKIHAAITLMVIALALFLKANSLQWAILVITIGVVFSAEMFNTVIEALVDLASPEINPLAKVAKDVAAGAVFLLAIIGVLVGLLTLGPALWQYVINLLF